MACACEHLPVAQLLIASGADVGAKDDDGCTPVELANAQLDGATPDGVAVLPLRLSLAGVDSSAPVESAINTHAHADALARARDEGRPVLLLDGLDEIADAARRDYLGQPADASRRIPRHVAT